MFLIKTCPTCGRRIRFPIDKGTIRVKCLCGSGFLADPDDPRLYEGAVFDLSTGKKKAGLLRRRLNNLAAKANFRLIVPFAINALFGLKYDLQNFRLLPSSRQRRIVLILVVILIVLLSLFYLLLHRTPPDIPRHDGITI